MRGHETSTVAPVRPAKISEFRLESQREPAAQKEAVQDPGINQNVDIFGDHPLEPKVELDEGEEIRQGELFALGFLFLSQLFDRLGDLRFRIALRILTGDSQASRVGIGERRLVEGRSRGGSDAEGDVRVDDRRG